MNYVYTDCFGPPLITGLDLLVISLSAVLLVVRLNRHTAPPVLGIMRRAWYRR